MFNSAKQLILESHSAKESTCSLLPSDLNTSSLKYYLCRAVSRTCKLKKLFSYISTKHLSRSHSHTNAQIILEGKNVILEQADNNRIKTTSSTLIFTFCDILQYCRKKLLSIWKYVWNLLPAEKLPSCGAQWCPNKVFWVVLHIGKQRGDCTLWVQDLFYSSISNFLTHSF